MAWVAAVGPALPARLLPADPGAVSDSGLDAIRVLIGSATCSDDRQCAVLAVGSRACGGPEFHLAWSTRTIDEARLQRAARDYADRSRPPHRQLGQPSTCEVRPTPDVACQNSRCVLIEAGRLSR